MKKVLIIEPDQNMLRDTSSFLYNNGFEVVETREGTSGIQKALECMPDIILCDTESPGLTGYEVLNTLQQINTTAIIPFILIKSNPNYEDIKAIMRLGADDCIIKPFENNDLLALIKTKLEKQERIIHIADEKFNTLMEFASNGIFIYQDGRITYVNQKLCETFAYSQNELLGMNLVNIVYKDDIHLIAEKIERALKGIHKDIQVDLRVISRDQKLVRITLTGSCITIRGKKSIIGSIFPLESKSADHASYNINQLEIKITKREKEIIQYICDGLSNGEIGEKLYISERTVEGHRANILKKTSCKNTARLAIFAIKHGLYEIN